MVRRWDSSFKVLTWRQIQNAGGNKYVLYLNDDSQILLFYLRQKYKHKFRKDKLNVCIPKQQNCKQKSVLNFPDISDGQAVLLQEI